MITIHPHFSILYHSNDQRKNIEQLIQKTKNKDSFIAFKTSGSTGNPKPIFAFENVKIDDIIQFGKEKNHIRLVFKNKKGLEISAIHFFAGEKDVFKKLDIIINL